MVTHFVFGSVLSQKSNVALYIFKKNSFKDFFKKIEHETMVLLQAKKLHMNALFYLFLQKFTFHVKRS